MSFRNRLKSIPLLRGAVARARGLLAPERPFTSSADYWQNRYRAGGDSGGGSYGRLARFKADFLNRFVEENDIGSVIEFGSGDGAQLELARYPNYTGVDISRDVIELCRRKFEGRDDVTFLHVSELEGQSADLALSLDVIYHLVEDDVFDAHMRQVLGAANRYAIFYSSDYADSGLEWDTPSDHVRHRKFSDWIAENDRRFELIRHVPNPHPPSQLDKETSCSDFYVYQRTDTRL